MDHWAELVRAIGEGQEVLRRYGDQALLANVTLVSDVLRGRPPDTPLIEAWVRGHQKAAIELASGLCLVAYAVRP